MTAILIASRAALVAAALSAVSADAAGVNWSLEWSFRHNDPDGADGAEVNAYDPVSQQMFVTGDEGVDVLTKDGVFVKTLRLSDTNDTVNSVAVKDGIVAMVGDVGGAGRVRFFDTDGNFIRDVGVGTGPDMSVFTTDGSRLLVAIEGEEDGIDPLGGVDIIDVATGTRTALDFTGFEGQKSALASQGALFRPGKTLAEDVEPEFIAVSPDGTEAYVTLQENNMVAVVDLTGPGAITELQSLGLKDVTTADNAFRHRSSNPVPSSEGLTGVTALYQPDGIATFERGGIGYMLTVDEGENLGNNRGIPVDPAKVPAATQAALDPATFDPQTFWNLDLDTDGFADTVAYSGGRSISIRTLDGTLVWDAGNVIEQAVIANGLLGGNSSRWNRLSIEPENVAIGELGSQLWAFVGVERGLSIATFNISDPLNPLFGGLIFDESLGDAFDEFEGLTFISTEDSWDGNSYLLASAEEDAWTHLFQLSAVPEPATWGMMIAGFGLVGSVARRRRALAA